MARQKLARTEFSSALNALATESGLDPSVVLEAIRQAITAAYRRDAREQGKETEGLEFDIKLDPQSGEAKVFSWEEGKEDKKKDVTPPGFGRIAVQTAKQVILQKIREAEKDAILFQFEGKVGFLVSGLILRFDGPNVKVDLGRTEAVLPPAERTPSERFSLNQRLTFLLKEIKETEHGKEIILSRSHPKLVEKLFAREVPEIASGAVEIKAVAREPGHRTKLAVASTQQGVDPVGSCVGQRGVRVQAVINELADEKIDIIPWTEDPSQLIKAALAPAENATVKLNEERKEAIVKVAQDQLSMAIGRDGQNVRLAGRLTGWKIEIEEARPEKKETGKEDKVKKTQKTKKKTKKEPEVKKEAEPKEQNGN